MIKAFIIKNLVSKTKKTKKKLKLIVEASIFLIISALISSIISIYFENKNSVYNKKLTSYEFEELKIQEWMKDSAEVNLDNRDGKFLFYLAGETDSISLKKSRYYFNLLSFYPTNLEYALNDALEIGNENLRNKYEINKKLEKNKIITEYVQNIFKNMPKYKDDEYTEVEDIKLQNDYFENLDKDLIYNYLDQTEKMMMEVGLYFQEYNNLIDKEKILLIDSIDQNTKKSTNLIFYAFALQLIIFGIIQFFELREVT